ncbi:unnamed protein product [Paramecium primaurelia]|uniref:Uncharacterized protein n=1 Tax=Paramecium primaurelia TaxID=5886 RepID=A0A8S1LKY1_PARPR|nr:unnamed protein product [Paramecium primaurelia]
MNFNRQESLSRKNTILQRPNRLYSIQDRHQTEDLKILVELSCRKNSIQDHPSTLKQPNSQRSQLQKYRNLYLYDKRLFKNRREHKSSKENCHDQKESKFSIKLQMPSFHFNQDEEMKIFKLKLMKSELIRNKIPDVSKDAKSTHLHNNKKISNLNLDPLKFTNLVVLPSVRGWDNNNQSSYRSN